MFNKKCLTLILSFFSILINSCTQLPISDETKEILDQAKDRIFSEDRFLLYDENELNDKKISKYLQQVLQPILEISQIKDISVEVVDAYEAQGMVNVDGTIYISKGMLYAIKNEAELVGLLAHEVGHLKLKHLKQDKEDDSRIEGIKDVIQSTTGVSIPQDVEEDVEDLYLSQFNQRKEQHADEYGAKTASQLGYNAYMFGDLFDRLDSMSDQSITKKIQNVFKGSHKSLGERAKYIRIFLEKNNIERSGKILEENYLKNVGHLGATPKPSVVFKAQKNLLGIYQELQQRSQNKTPLTVEEFILYMQRIRSTAKDLNLLSQLKFQSKNSSPTNNFMMESVKVLKPWWAPQNQNLNKLNDTLLLLGKMGLGKIPVMGDAIDMYEVLTGTDFFTGESLTFGERTASAIGIIASSGSKWRTVGKELGVLKSNVVDEKDLSKIANAATDAIEHSPILGKSIKASDGLIGPQYKELVEKQYRQIKNEENYKVLTDLANKAQPKKIPDDWKVKITKIKKREGRHQGLEFIHPNDNQIRIRVMPGNPDHKWPNSKKPYVIQQKGNRFYDKYGKLAEKESNASHIPLDEWSFFDFWGKD